jgi:hypothetical protein
MGTLDAARTLEKTVDAGITDRRQIHESIFLLKRAVAAPFSLHAHSDISQRRHLSKQLNWLIDDCDSNELMQYCCAAQMRAFEAVEFFWLRLRRQGGVRRPAPGRALTAATRGSPTVGVREIRRGSVADALKDGFDERKAMRGIDPRGRARLRSCHGHRPVGRERAEIAMGLPAVCLRFEERRDPQGRGT